MDFEKSKTLFEMKKRCKSFEAQHCTLITCIGTEQEKVGQDVTDYKLELKISMCILVNF